MKIYIGRNPSSPDGGYTADEIARGIHWVNADIECPHCGKNQPVAVTGYLGGPCIKCGKLTSGAEPAPKRTKEGHVLMTSKTCTFCNRDPDRTNCPVCDGGLSVCVRCGMAESELDQPCPGERMTRSIQGAWLRLSGKLATQGWPPEILEKLRKIFYGGAGAGIFLTLDMLDANSDDRALPILDEIRAFTDEVQAG